MLKRVVIFLMLAGCCPGNCPTSSTKYPDPLPEGVRIPTTKTELCKVCDMVEERWHVKMMEACLKDDSHHCPERITYHYSGLLRECEFQKHLWGCDD